ncbi:hypothetical protein M885DRAFT_586231 [Pelagophyceae sp. CCMP2097]|nr:hypothetical protein M885DRAFT_586231 [Pelagophyceae sp. CCMP2097]|mmetsp:Transcript_6853/g.22209  ORF Transcript_6853/g.22209 Transcript_6853/m.22209 type:complete len:263 (-) Transcript_6853:83-871(-)
MIDMRPSASVMRPSASVSAPAGLPAPETQGLAIAETEAPHFANASLATDADVVVSSNVLEHRGGGRPVLAEVASCGGSAEVYVARAGFNLSFGALVPGAPCTDLQRGAVPHHFLGGAALRESGEWLHEGICVRDTGCGYDTFKDGDVVLLRCVGSVLEIDRVRGSVVSPLGRVAVAGAGELVPYVMLRGLDESKLVLEPKRPAFSVREARRYPRPFNDAVHLVDSLARKRGVALPTDALESVFAFVKWSDFFTVESPRGTLR